MQSILRRAAFALLLTTVAVAQDSPSLLYSVANPTPGQRLLLRQHFDVLDGCCGGAANAAGALEVIVHKDQVAALLAITPTAKLVEQGRPFADIALERAIASPNDVPDANYYTVAEIEAAIDAQVAAHPTIARKVNLSALPGGTTTIEGRPIYALKVSDNVALDEDEPAIVLAAQHHARELNTPPMVIGAMQRVLAGYGTNATLTSLVNGYELWFVPMVNPDGVNHVWTTDNLWRKNRRDNGGGVYGVDLNRNYPTLWSLCGASTVTSSETYQGTAAGSEPEGYAMRNFVALMQPEIYLDFHSYGQDVLRTYAPCATVSTTMHNFVERYVDDLCTQLTYSKRDPSGSGEAPEDHWAKRGTLSFLIEVGTAFQPAYSATVTEEARVWPGVNRVLSAWRPALRGHVRSSLGNAPLAATITFTPNVFNHGEVTKSRGRDGRYGLWLPIGSWNVTFAAPNHLSQTIPVTVSTYDSPVTTEIVLQSTSCARYVPDTAATGPNNTIPFGTVAATTLPTVMASNNGGSVGGAVYFDLQPATNLFLTGLDVNTSAPAGTPLTAELHSCSTTYAGNEVVPAAWSVRTILHGVSAGQDQPSHLELDQPQLLGTSAQGWALVARDFAHRYTNGTGSNQAYSDSSLAFAAGSATNTPFVGPVFSPRVANLTLHYRTDTSAWTNQLYQTVLRREQLAGAGAITGLAFAPATTGRHFERQLRIRMSHVPSGHTLSTTFATNLPTPVTVLDKWDYSWQTTADQWTEIGLTDEFVYDGVSDVVVEVFARGNHDTAASGFHRGNGDVPRVSASGFPFSAVPTVATVNDNSGQRVRIAFRCATASEHGTSCGALLAGHTGSGARGTAFRFDVAGAVPNSGAIVALGFVSYSPFGTSLSSYGFPGCFSWNDATATVFHLTDAVGAANHTIAAPASSSFDGLHLYGQWFQLDPAQPGGMTASNQTRWVLGTAP